MPRQPRRRAALIVPLAAVTAVTAVAALTACSPAAGASSDEERAALSAWGDDLIAAAGGGVGGEMSVDASASEVGQDFPSPTDFTSVQLRCKGTDRAQFTLRYTGSWGTQVLTQELVCHDGGLLTPIAIPIDAQQLTRFAASATSPDGQGYWVAIPQQ